MMRTMIETAEAVRRGDVTAVEVLEECFTEIERRGAPLNAFAHLDPDFARSQAQRIDAILARGEDPGLLAGVPFGVKDLEDCAGMPTGHGSLLYSGRPPAAEDSVHVRRLRAAGAVPVGKTTAPEFGATCFTATKACGVTRNPWDLDRTPGGSSGGSAAAVAAGLLPFCTASDGGGSTRIPAAFTGLVGMKPSYGRIPHPGGGESETSVHGALTTTVADAARHLDVTAGPDDRDRASLPPAGISYERAIEELDVTGMTATWSLDLGFAVVDPEVAELTYAAAERLVEAAGLRLVERPFAPTNPLRAWWGLGAIDINMDVERGMFPERAEEFMPDNRRSLEVTSTYSVAQFARQVKRRHRLEAEVAELFADVDLLLTPTTAVPAFAAEGPLPFTIDGRDASQSGPVPFTMLANLCWNPAVSVPAGTTVAGLPVGLQITARRHRDDVALRLARIFEQAAPWARFAPGPRPSAEPVRD